MNEPLNHIKKPVWPEWHQKPLTLTVQEVENPFNVFEQFFQCYHLPDIRECLKTWLHDSLSKDTIESKQNISTHREVEKLVEAVWVINNSFHPDTSKKCQQTRGNQNCANEKRENVTDNNRYQKQELLIEKAARNPAEAIQEVFFNNTIGDFLDFLLPNWLRTALINSRCRYSDDVGAREILCEFYDQLLLLTQALFIITEKNQLISGKQKKPEELLLKYKRHDIPFLSTDQIGHPESVVAAFYEKFSIEYVRRELRDFLDAGVGYLGTYPNEFTPWFAFIAYEDIACLTEAAYCLHLRMTANVQHY